MEFYETLEKRRTYRDWSDREVSDEILKRVISAAFKAPTNDHLRQLEFVVVHGRADIAKVIAPLAKNIASFRELVFEADDTGDKKKMEMFADAPAQAAENAHAERAAHPAVLPPEAKSPAETCGTKLPQLFRICMVRVGEHAVSGHCRGPWSSFPHSGER